MPHWNTKQKILLDIAIVLFIAINTFTFFLIFPDLKIDLFNNTSEISVKLTNIPDKPDETTNFNYGENITFSSGTIVVSSNEINTLVGQSPISLIIDKDSSLTVTKGIAYIDTKKPVKLNLGRESVDLPTNTKGIINSNDHSIFIVSGKLQLNNKTVQTNDNIIWNVDILNITSFDRSKLRTRAEYSSLLQTLTELSIKEEYLEHIDPPKIYSLTPKSGTTITDTEVEITGQTDAGSKLVIDNVKVNVDESGQFKLKITLIKGNNPMKVEVSDKYGNVNSTNVIYYKL